MIANITEFEQTRFYQDIYRTGEKKGKKEGKKEGKKAFIIEEIQRFNKMKEKGDLSESLFNTLCAPLRDELKKLKKEFSELRRKKHWCLSLSYLFAVAHW